MISAKGFMVLCVPLTISIYLLLLNILGYGIVPIWISLPLTLVFGGISVVVLLIVSEREEKRLLSDHMNTRG